MIESITVVKRQTLRPPQLTVLVSTVGSRTGRVAFGWKRMSGR